MGTIFAAFLSFLSLFTTGDNGKLRDDVMVWGSPVTLSNAVASDPQIVIDVNGNATAAWIENGSMRTSSQPVGGSWSASYVLSSSGASSPQLAIDASGNVTAIWVESGIVQSSLLPFGGSWSTPTAASGASVGSPVLAVNGSGSGVAGWVRSNYVESAIKTAPLGSLSLANTLSGSPATHPAAHIGEDGTICAVWHTNSSGTDVIQAATQAPNGSWSSPQTIAPATGFSYGYPKVSVDHNGNPTAVFYHYSTTESGFNNVAMHASSYSGGVWSDPVPLLNDGQLGVADPSTLTAKVQFDSVGNALVLWGQSYDGSTFSVESATFPVGGTGWEVGQSMSTEGISYQTDMAVNGLGEALSAYMYFDGTYATIQATETGTSGLYNGGPTWSIPVEISMPGTNNGYPKAASTYNSETETMYAAVVWLTSSGGNVYVQAATGLKTPIQPPSGLTVVQGSNQFGVFTQYYNTLSWTPTPSPEVNQYAVYRNGVLFAVVDGGITQIVDQNAVEGGSVTYGVGSLDNGFLESVVAEVSYP